MKRKNRSKSEARKLRDAKYAAIPSIVLRNANNMIPASLQGEGILRTRTLGARYVRKTQRAVKLMEKIKRLSKPKESPAIEVQPVAQETKVGIVAA